jgi:hypothetical protein
MQNDLESPVRLLTLENPDAFDTVEADDLEACRRVMSLTPPEFAEQLGWSPRKYQRVLEAAREDGFVDRDNALAVRGLLSVLLGSDDEGTTAGLSESDAILWESPEAKAFLGGRTYPMILPKISEDAGPWTAQVTPHLFRLVTNGEAATTLEERNLTKRVWPRTLYGMPLGAICNSLMLLGEKAGFRIPLLSVIVVKASGQPGAGVDGMIRKFVRQHESMDQAREILIRLKRDRDSLVGELQQEVFEFQDWPGVIRALGLGES